MSTELKTRIALKYDSYANWTNENLGLNKGANLVLLPGEIGICEIPAENTDFQVAPTVLFKVGGAKYPEGDLRAGQLMAFKDLPWASAKAADVYSWAKAETIEVSGTKLVFKTGSSVKKEVDLSNFATSSSLDDIISRLDALESNTSGGVITESQYQSLADRLDRIESVDSSKSGSLAYVLAQAESFASDAHSDAVDDAKDYTDRKVALVESKYDEVYALYNTLDRAIKAEENARETDDNAIKAIIGGEFTETATVAKAIEDAKAVGQQGINDAAKVAQDLVTLVASGKVHENAENITGLSARLDEFDTIADDVETRLTEVEAFFKTTENESINAALDTLVEIQEYLLSEDGSATGGLLDRLSGVEEALDDFLGEDGEVTQKIEALESFKDEADASIATLLAITTGYSESFTVASDIAAIKTSTKNISEAVTTAQESADNAQESANIALNNYNIINTTVTGLIGRVDSAASGVDELQALVQDNTTAINELKELTEGVLGDNETLSSTLSEIQGSIDEHKSRLDEITAKVGTALTDSTSALSRLDAIENDYLTSQDEFIIQCGTATTINHGISETEN